MNESHKGSATHLIEEIQIKINSDILSGLIKSNLSCYNNKSLNQELIDTITNQIIDSIDYFLNK
jgi:hypothetical protein